MAPKKGGPAGGQGCSPRGGITIDPKNENLRQLAVKLLRIPSVVALLKQHQILGKIRGKGRKPVLLAQYPATPPPGTGGSTS